MKTLSLNKWLGQGIKGISVVLILTLALTIESCSKSESLLKNITVEEVYPEDGATEVDVNSEISVVFSDDLDISSVNENTFIVKKRDYPIYGTVSCSGNKAVFKAFSQLVDSKQYNCTITLNVKGEKGQTLSSEYHWSFTSGVAPDFSAPVIENVSPVDQEDLVFTDNEIAIVFNEEMDAETINGSTVILKTGTSVVSGELVLEGNVVKFSPDNALVYNTEYSCLVMGSVKDLAGNSMGDNYEWRFTTVPEIIGFNEMVKPIFKADNCYTCHNQNRDPDLREGNAYQSLIDGAFVDVNNPEGSRIVEMLKGEYHKDFTTAKEKRIILEWIKQGAQNN